MSNVPNGTEAVRPFLPAKDFDLSKRFYGALGFEKVLDADVAIFKNGLEWVHFAALLPEGMGREFHDAADGRRFGCMVGAHSGF